ncbi:hypothetical protein [Endozoicomonas ascidiicola]|uniref:hypothetical protein n=1 Tax=Endozoicomonas ascidiicola TaxID=1698521 RepID=UPI000A9C94E4|nr:hypothetical protein [Endozoicomonas ascidiicola]
MEKSDGMSGCTSRSMGNLAAHDVSGKDRRSSSVFVTSGANQLPAPVGYQRSLSEVGWKSVLDRQACGLRSVASPMMFTEEGGMVFSNANSPRACNNVPAHVPRCWISQVDARGISVKHSSRSTPARVLSLPNADRLLKRVPEFVIPVEIKLFTHKRKPVVLTHEDQKEICGFEPLIKHSSLIGLDFPDKEPMLIDKKMLPHKRILFQKRSGDVVIPIYDSEADSVCHNLVESLNKELPGLPVFLLRILEENFVNNPSLYIASTFNYALTNKTPDDLREVSIEITEDKEKRSVNFYEKIKYVSFFDKMKVKPLDGDCAITANIYLVQNKLGDVFGDWSLKRCSIDMVFETVLKKNKQNNRLSGRRAEAVKRSTGIPCELNLVTRSKSICFSELYKPDGFFQHDESAWLASIPVHLAKAKLEIGKISQNFSEALVAKSWEKIEGGLIDVPMPLEIGGLISTLKQFSPGTNRYQEFIFGSVTVMGSLNQDDQDEFMGSLATACQEVWGKQLSSVIDRYLALDLITIIEKDRSSLINAGKPAYFIEACNRISRSAEVFKQALTSVKELKLLYEYLNNDVSVITIKEVMVCCLKASYELMKHNMSFRCAKEGFGKIGNIEIGDDVKHIIGTSNGVSTMGCNLLRVIVPDVLAKIRGRVAGDDTSILYFDQCADVVEGFNPSFDKPDEIDQIYDAALIKLRSYVPSTLGQPSYSAHRKETVVW